MFLHKCEIKNQLPNSNSSKHITFYKPEHASYGTKTKPRSLNISYNSNKSKSRLFREATV